MRRFSFFLFTVTLCCLSYNVFTNAGGPVTGVAGDPPFNETCAAAGCHTGSPLNSGGGIASISCLDSIGNTVTSYVPNTTYTITLSITEGAKTRYGFEAIVRKGGGIASNAIGTIIVTDAVKTQIFGGSIKYIMHKTAGIDFAGTTASWSFDWKAPPANNGIATIYAAFNATNKNTQVTGDNIYTKTLDLPGTGPFVGINSEKQSANVRLFPNPAVSQVNIDLLETSCITIYNANGEEVRTTGMLNGSLKFDIHDLPSGIYFAVIKSEYNMTSKKIIKQ